MKLGQTVTHKLRMTRFKDDATPGPEVDLSAFLDRRDAGNLGDAAEPFADRPGGWLDLMAQAADLHPMGRIGTPDEVAGLIVWLCSAEAGFMTGAVVPVDGGFVAQ